jgi:hypothetical protein
MTIESCGAIRWGKLARPSLPALQWLPQYNKGWPCSDAVPRVDLSCLCDSGLGSLCVPCGLPQQAGLCCYLLEGAVHVAFGTSRHLAIGLT